MQHSFKHFFDSRTVKTLVVSALTVLIILLIAFGAIWYNRGRIFRYFANGYVQSVAASETKTGSADILAAAGQALPAAFSSESRIESAVQTANPAVVAITVSKDVPQYKNSYQ